MVFKVRPLQPPASPQMSEVPRKDEKEKAKSVGEEVIHGTEPGEHFSLV